MTRRLSDGAVQQTSHRGPELLTARLLEDCARNLRIEYTLPVPITQPLFERAGSQRTVVNEFSQHVDAAQDHIVGTFGDAMAVRAEGSIGASTLVVTFGSLHARARPEAVMQFETALRAALVGSPVAG